MAIARDHELHKRRLGRNVGLGLVLAGFVALIFGLTVAKIDRGGEIEGYDHTFRSGLTEPAQ
ncbi:hypothetical protein C2I36_03855 [Rhodobacteraceae bacterium WD3A24]|nr:hypothetical protein C2I36_03855 [Rhodobacteraceae bacterium WD3A24]